MKRIFTGLLALAATAALATAAQAEPLKSGVDTASVPKNKQVKSGLYLTPRDAFEAMTTRKDVVFIDVRDAREFQFVGFPKVVTKNIPYRVVNEDLDFDAKRKQFKMVPNIDFPAAVKALLEEKGFGPDVNIIVQCRSGPRSAGAANYLVDIGYTNVWQQVEGMEGDKDKASGHRVLNGWKNKDLPWTYALSEEVMYVSPSF